MKKILICSIISAIILMFSSCGKSSTEPINMGSQYKCKVEISYHDKVRSAEFERQKNGTWLIKFNSPGTLNGMSIEYSNNNCTIGYKNLTYKSDRSSFPQESAINLITKALNNLTTHENINFFEKDSKVIAEGIVDGVDYCFSFEGNELSALEITGEEVYVKFSDIQK